MLYLGSTPLGLTNVTIGTVTNGPAIANEPEDVIITEPGSWDSEGDGYSFACHYDYSKYSPNPSWPTLPGLRTLYPESYVSAYYVVVTTDADSTVLSGATAYRCSDTPNYLDTSGGTHTWDTTQDITTTDGSTFRWIIYYFSSVNVTLNAVGKIPLQTVYLVFDACNITNIVCLCL